MGLLRNHAIMDVIRCDEPDYLIWKWHPAGTGEKAEKKSNSIRWGSSLRVRDGSVAVFVYPQESGVAQEYIEGPFDAILETRNLPILTEIFGTVYNGDSPFQAEIYFINLAELIQIRFGVPYFDVFDPRFLDFGVPVAVRGTIGFRITDYKEFVRLHRLDHFDLEAFQSQIKDVVIKTVKQTVTNIPEECNIPVIQIEKKIPQINAVVEEELKQRLLRDFGVSVSGVDIAAIEVDKTSEGYRELKAVTQDISSAKIRTQGDVDVQKMRDMEPVEVKHTAGILRTQRITGLISGVIASIHRPVNIPPTLPKAKGYYIALNGEPTGPYDSVALEKLLSVGTFLKESLVWAEGMAEWRQAGQVEELQYLFAKDS